MRYDTVLLDLDHTLFDSDTSEAEAFRQTLLNADVDNPMRLYSLYQKINVDLWSAVERGEIMPTAVKVGRFERFVDAAGIEADPRRMAEDFVTGLAENGELYSGTADVVARLSADVRLGLITNGLSEVQRTRLTRLDIGDHFDAVTISAEVGASKPSGAIFDAAFSALGQPNPKTTLMVGDNLNSDIRGGANYGLATCWFNPKGRVLPDGHETTYEIAHLRDLLALIV